MNFEDAVDFLIKHANMEKVSAITEVKRYTQTPTYQLSYRIGKHLIKKLKEEGKNKMGERFSGCFFHDTLLTEGNMSVYYLKDFLKRKLGKHCLHCNTFIFENSLECW